MTLISVSECFSQFSHSNRQNQKKEKILGGKYCVATGKPKHKCYEEEYIKNRIPTPVAIIFDTDKGDKYECYKM